MRRHGSSSASGVLPNMLPEVSLSDSHVCTGGGMIHFSALRQEIKTENGLLQLGAVECDLVGNTVRPVSDHVLLVV